jgi:hypothetical protein
MLHNFELGWVDQKAEAEGPKYSAIDKMVGLQG